MESIADNVYIEDQYIGVILGVISLPRGIIQIDAPPSPEDGRAWRATLLNLRGGPERVLINLDTHPDRTLGARAMDCTVIAHEKTAQVFRNHPTTFKAQGEETGADWESIPGLGNVRWAPPEISFSQQMTLHWGNAPVLLEHHPGPASGAIWVILAEEKIVYVGDAILKNQPPFLIHASLPDWIETLETLLGPEYRNFTVISSRGGLVATATIRGQLEYLKLILEKIEKLAAKQSPPEATESLIQPLLSAFKFPAAKQKQYAQRLRYGLHHYYLRHCHPTNTLSEE